MAVAGLDELSGTRGSTAGSGAGASAWSLASTEEDGSVAGGAGACNDDFSFDGSVEVAASSGSLADVLPVTASLAFVSITCGGEEASEAGARRASCPVSD